MTASVANRPAIWGQVLETSGTTVLSVAASMISLFITARYLGPEGRGIYAAAFAWVALAATVGSLSLGQVVIHHAAGRPVGQWLPETAGTCLTIGLAVSLLSWGAVAVAYAGTDGRAFDNLSPLVLVLAFAALPLRMTFETNRYILNAMGALRVANGAQVLGSLLTLVGVIAFVAVFRIGVPGALLALLLGSLANAVLGQRAIARRSGHLRPNTATAARLLGGSARLHLSSVGNYLLAQSSVLILNHFRSPAETGFYQLALQLFGLALIASRAVSTVAFGIVAEHGPDRAWPQQRRLIWQALALVAMIAAAGYLLAPIGIRLVAGEAFLPAVPVFRWILPALLGATFSTIMASQWVGRGLFWQAAMMTLATGLISVACDFAFIPQHGMYGALVSTLVTYGVAVILNGGMAVWIDRKWRASVA